MFPHYLSQVVNQFFPVYYLVVVELAEESAPAHTPLRVHLCKTTINRGDGQLMDHPVEFPMVEVLDKTGIIVRIQEILLINPCSHKLQNLFDLILPQQLIHLLEDKLKIGLDLQLSDLFSFCSGDMIGVVP